MDKGGDWLIRQWSRRGMVMQQPMGGQGMGVGGVGVGEGRKSKSHVGSFKNTKLKHR